MSTTPRPRKDPQRAEAPGSARTPASAKPCLSGSLSAYSKGPASMVSMPRSENNMQDRLLEPLVHDDLVGRRIDLGHPGLAGVEQLDGLFHQLRRVGVGRRELVSPLPELFDARLQISHGSP